MCRRSLALLTQRAQGGNAEHILRSLCDKLLTGKLSHREIMCIALKTIISEVKATFLMSLFGTVVTPALLEGLDTPVRMSLF